MPLKKPGDLFNSNKNAPKESSIDLNGNIPNIKEEFDKVEDLREQLNNVSSSLNNSLTEVVNKNLNFLSDEYAQQLDKFNNKIDKFKEEIVYKVNNLKKSNSDLKADIQIVEQRQNKINITVITEEVLSGVQDVLSGNLEENIKKLEDKIEIIKEAYEENILKEGLLNEPPSTDNEDPLTPLDKNYATIDDLNKHYQLFLNRIQQQLSTVGGGGAVNIKDMDDVDSSAFVDGKVLEYDSTLKKWKGGTGGGGSGTKGQKGETGSDGSDGSDGTKGQKGEIGVGQKGEAGTEKGQKGEVGPGGGDKGDKGEPSTVAGDKGQKGEIGVGQKGEPSTVKGQKGEVGSTGSNGSAGAKGQKGEVGSTGSSGSTGNTGSKGQKGEVGSGSTGDKGQKGETGGGGGSGLDTRGTTSAATGSIAQTASANITISTRGKSFSLLKVAISAPAWVVLYVDSASRSSDSSRSEGTDPAPGAGVLTEVSTTTSGASTFLMSPAVLGWNNDSTPAAQIYAKVTNKRSTSGSNAITVTLTTVGLEA